jgi:hypothetical protein
MQSRGDRRILRLSVQIDLLLVVLKRHGYLKKEYILSKELCEFVEGPTVLPDEARLVGAQILAPAGAFLLLDIEADSFGDAIAGQNAQVYLSRPEMTTPA